MDKLREKFEAYFENETGWSASEYPSQEVVALCWLLYQQSRESLVALESCALIPCTERLPESKPGMMWSNEVAALSNLGDVFKLSCMGDYWQRTSEFIDSGATSITHWISLPEDK